MTRRLDNGELAPDGAERAGEDPIELQRYLDALRRGIPLILAMALVLAASTYVVSRSLTKHYRAEASIVRQQLTAADEGLSVDSITRELNTMNKLLGTDDMLGAAAAKLPGETADSLRAHVTSRVDPDANLIYVTGTASSADRAAQISNAVAQTFVTKEAQVERSQAELARSQLQDELAQLRGQPNSAVQIQAVESRLSDLNIEIASAGTELAVAQRAVPPTSASSPHPSRNAWLALVLGLLLGSLIVLVNDQLSPRFVTAQELSHALDVPLLLTVPRRRMFGPGAESSSEREAYRVLAAALRSRLPAGGKQVVVVASAVPGEGKTTVATSLGPGSQKPAAQPARASSASSKTRSSSTRTRSSRTRPRAAVADNVGFAVVDGPSLLTAADPQTIGRSQNVLFVAKVGHLTREQARAMRQLFARLEWRPIGLVALGGNGTPAAYHVPDREPAPEDL